MGDEVVAEGGWSNGVFVAAALLSLLRSVEGAIVEIAADRLVTTGGTVAITPHTKRAGNASWTVLARRDLRVGDEVSVLARSDPTSADLVAVAIFLPAA